MISEKYAKYYKSQPVGDFTRLYPQLTAPSFHIHGREWNSGYRMDWFCVTEPFLMINDPHTHDFDQFLAFQGADATRVNDFDAEVWLYLGPEGRAGKAGHHRIVLRTRACWHGAHPARIQEDRQAHRLHGYRAHNAVCAQAGGRDEADNGGG